jgi:hypothetical protein
MRSCAGRKAPKASLFRSDPYRFDLVITGEYINIATAEMRVYGGNCYFTGRSPLTTL